MKSSKRNIYIGFDEREEIAFDIARFSIEEKTSEFKTVELNQKILRRHGDYWREPDKKASTEFSITRFLVPHLNSFSDWALFVDCDILFLSDPQELFDLADDRYALMCAKHDYRPSSKTKMDSQVQHLYPRKNWSSMMLFNCSHPSNQRLTRELVNSGEPGFLHQMKWLNDDEIGEISHEWNWLVDWYKEPDDGKARMVHYTEGGPWFDAYRDCEYSEEWIEMKRRYETSLYK